MIGFVSQHGNIPKGYENRLRLVNGINAKARYMTVEEFATALGISTKTVYRWVKMDSLKTRQEKPGSKILISIAALMGGHHLR